MLPSAPMLLGALVGAIVLFGSGFWAGDAWRDRAWKADLAEVQSKAIELEREDRRKLNQIASRFEAEKEKIRVVYRSHPVPVRADSGDVCFDAERLRHANRSLDGPPDD